MGSNPKGTGPGGIGLELGEWGRGVKLQSRLEPGITNPTIMVSELNSFPTPVFADMVGPSRKSNMKVE